MKLDEAKQRIRLLQEVGDIMFEQAWQHSGLPENMRDDLFDHLCNDYTSKKMADWMKNQESAGTRSVDLP